MSKEETVDVGTHVEIELINRHGDRERLAFDIVPQQTADFDRGRLGESTPLARTILDEPAGAVLPYTMGDMQQVRIVSVRPSSNSEGLEDTASQRQAALKKALNAIERTNAALFASSFSGKWGDYDPAGIEAWEGGEDED